MTSKLSQRLVKQRRLTFGLLFLLLLAATLAVGGHTPANACTCGRPPLDLRPDVYEADEAFVGTVVDITKKEEHTPFPVIRRK